MSYINGKQIKDNTITQLKLNLSNPTQNYEAVNKEYFDTIILNYSNTGHTHLANNITDLLYYTGFSNYYLNTVTDNLINQKLSLTGGTINGLLFINDDLDVSGTTKTNILKTKEIILINSSGITQYIINIDSSYNLIIQNSGGTNIMSLDLNGNMKILGSITQNAPTIP